MRLNVYRAAGGVVIEARTYDPQRDRHHQSLHVITHDQDLATSLDRIITMESLRG
jgi:ABC-type lipoprotein export system ATPase subunit